MPQGQRPSFQGQGQGTEISPRGVLKDKDQGQGLTSLVNLLLLYLVLSVLPHQCSVQKSTQDRTFRAFIPAILLNMSLCHCSVTHYFCSVILKSLDLRHV